MQPTQLHDANKIVEELRAYVERSVARNGGSTVAVKPSHRVKFHWPPHPESYSYHVLSTDWTGVGSFESGGETFSLTVAKTPFGVFGRSDELWLEARGDSYESMIQAILDAAQPLFRRQAAIANALERDGRFTGKLRDLIPSDLVKLLYCEDRDVANEAHTEIETHASSHIFSPALVEILRDRRHAHRRSAQWCVLDLFEDLPSFCTTSNEEGDALEAMKELIWDAEDDYARTVYKAGVVLGGHLPHRRGGDMLMQCLEAPSPIGRRSAIHGLFHVVEWVPAAREDVVRALRGAAEKESVPLLKAFAAGMASDIERANYEHLPEPIFDSEA